MNSIATPSRFFRWHCVTVMVVICLGIGRFAGTVAAQTSDSPDGKQVDQAGQDAEQIDDESDLPDHAVWRYGEVGKLKKQNGFYRLKFSPDGKLLATRNQENTLFLIDVETQETLFEFNGYEDRQWIQNIDFSPDSKLMLTATTGANETISIWDTKTGKLYRDLEIDGKVAYFRSPTEITVLRDEVVLTYSVETGKQLSSLKWGDRGDLPLNCSRDGRTVVFEKASSGRRSYSVFICDVLNQTTSLGLSTKAKPRGTAISEDGNWLAVTFRRDKIVRIWDLRNPSKSTALHAHDETAESVCFSADNRFLATTGWDSQVHIWDVLTGKRIDNLEGHIGHVTACDFIPNQFKLATGANSRQDNSILVWDFRSLVFPPVDPAGEFEIDGVWDSLGSSDFHRSFGAISVLVENSGKFESAVSERLGIVSAGNSSNKIEKWIEQLSSRRYAQRLEAEDRLKRARLRSEPLLQQMLKRNDLTREVRYRILRVLRQPIERPKMDVTDLRRLHRIIYALELSGTEASLEVLQNLAETHEHVDVAHDAERSLKRVRANRSESVESE